MVALVMVSVIVYAFNYSRESKQCKKEVTGNGEVVVMDKDMGFFRTFKEIPFELGDAVTGKVPGRTSHEEKILTVNIGTGLADVATAKLLYDIALEKDLGTVLPL